MTMMKQKLWSANALGVELQLNPRTVARMLADVPADGTLHTRPAWFLSTAIRALGEYQSQSDRLNGRRLNGSTAAPLDPSLGRLEQLASEIAEGLGKLRAADPSERVATLETFGSKVGELDRWMMRTIAGQGADAVATLTPFRDAIMRETVQEIIELVGVSA